LFEGVLIGANLLESTPGATVSLSLNLLGAGRKLAIDPMTYTFGMSLAYIKSETLDRTSTVKGARKVGLKKSFAALAKRYGNPITSIVSKNRSVSPADFTPSNMPGFCRAIFEYQANRMREHCEADPQLREVAAECPTPSFVFAPYFYSWMQIIPCLGISESTAVRGKLHDVGVSGSPTAG
jgi:hypothetical protein